MANLVVNTIRYGTDSFSFNKSGLLISNTPLDCSAFTSVDGFTIAGQQATGTDRRVVFKISGTWYKLTGSGSTPTLTAVPTQSITSDSVLAEGNTVADLQAITSVPGFVGQQVTPAIALVAPGDGSVAYPTLQLGINGHSNQSQTSYTSTSPAYTLASSDVTVINATANTTITNNGTVTVTAALLQSGIWSAYQPLASVANQKASQIKFQAVYTAPTIGTSTAKVNNVTVQYRTNNSSVSGTIAELMTTTEDFQNGMRSVRLFVEHQHLIDAQLASYASFRDTPVQHTKVLIGVGNGQRQTLTVGSTKDSSGNIIADIGINHNMIQLFYGSQQAFDFDYNTAMSQLSCTAPNGTSIFVTYSSGWESETWVQMTQGSTQQYQDTTLDSTEFSYTLPSTSTAQGVCSVKLQLIKPTGTVTNASLGTATGSQQMFVLPHAAKSDSVILTDGTNPITSWSYDPNSQILTLVAAQNTNLVLSYNWVAETPVVEGFVAAWNE